VFLGQNVFVAVTVQNNRPVWRLLSWTWCGADWLACTALAPSHCYEVDSTSALEAVWTSSAQCPGPKPQTGRLYFCTVTGNKNVLAKEHFELIGTAHYLPIPVTLTSDRHFILGKDVFSKRTTRTSSKSNSLKTDARSISSAKAASSNLAAAKGIRRP